MMNASATRRSTTQEARTVTTTRLLVSAVLDSTGLSLMQSTRLWEFQGDGARPSAKNLADHLASVLQQGPVRH
jgi:hypothetical protein